MTPPEDNAVELAATIEKELALPQRSAALRKLRKKYSDQLENQYGSVVIRIALSLLRKRVPGARYMAYELLQHHPKATSMVGPKELFRLGAGLDSWEASDMFATYLVGPAWREGRIKDDVPEFWAKAPIKWYRRAVLLATIALNSKEQGGHGDAERTLKICSLLLADRDEMIVKAMVTALRELAKRDRAAVTKFVNDNREKISPRVLREFGNKVRTGKKTPTTSK